MRTAAICPTCATYENALCILYNGPFLANIGVSPLDSLEKALISINSNLVTSTGTGNPTVNPTHLGQFYVNTTTGVIYYATSLGLGAASWTIIGFGLGFTAENVVNKTTSASDIINFGTSITKYPSVKSIKDYVDQSVANIDLQTVLDNGHNLINGINLQGTNAGGPSLSGTNINAFGESSAYNNTGSAVNSLGYLSAYENVGDAVNALGAQTAVSNSGSDLNALGFSAAYNNSGSNVNSFGNSSGVSNTGTNVNVFGNLAGNNNTANNVNAFGDAAGQGNTRSNVNLFGSGASATANDQTVFVSLNGSFARIGYGGLTTSQLYALPNASGTLALISNIPTNYWKTIGNTGTTPGTDFIGTTDAVDFVTKTNSVERLRIGSTGNVGIGRTASTFLLEVNKDASVNDVRVGRGKNDIATNTTLGFESSNAITIGNQNTAVGYWTLKETTTGSNNTAVGYFSSLNNQTGSGNTAFGMSSMSGNQNGNANTAIGIGALANATGGDNNTAVGAYALASIFIATTSENTAIGRTAGGFITDGSFNTFIGGYTANTLTNGNYNTIIGSYVDVPLATTNGYVLIGDGQGNVRFKDDGTNTILPRLAGVGSRIVKAGTNGEISAVSGFTGIRTIGGEVYTWTDGILISVV
jgi:hypothetical protein